MESKVQKSSSKKSSELLDLQVKSSKHSKIVHQKSQMKMKSKKKKTFEKSQGILEKGYKSMKTQTLQNPEKSFKKGSQTLGSSLFLKRFNLHQSSPFLTNFLMTKGHLGSHKWTKDMTDSLVGIRHGMSVFDVEKTKIACSRMLNFLKLYQPKRRGFKKKLDILFVNTSEPYQHLIKKVALFTGQRYIHEKWVGGTLTNWSQVSQSYSLFGRFHLLFGDFLKKRKIHLPLYEKARRIYSGLLPKGMSEKKIKTTSLPRHLPRKLRSSFETTDGLPDILFLINPEENQNVLHEANLLKIPVIALADSNTKSLGIDYMIPGNVQSIEFVYWCLNLVTITLQKRYHQTFQKESNKIH